MFTGVDVAFFFLFLQVAFVLYRHRQSLNPGQRPTALSPLGEETWTRALELWNWAWTERTPCRRRMHWNWHV